jgi:hypothetical protein
MALDADSRMEAIFSAMSAANPNMSKLDSAEVQQMKDNIKTIFGADLDYLVGATVVNPSAIFVDTGTIVTVGGPTTQTGPPAPTPLTGTGTIS